MAEGICVLPGTASAPVIEDGCMALGNPVGGTVVGCSGGLCPPLLTPRRGTASAALRHRSGSADALPLDLQSPGPPCKKERAHPDSNRGLRVRSPPVYPS